MIIIEFCVNIIKFAWYIVWHIFIRFFVWIITARDCKHCKHGRQGYFYDGYEWECSKEDRRCVKECVDSITRIHFEHKDKGDCE